MFTPEELKWLDSYPDEVPRIAGGEVFQATNFLQRFDSLELVMFNIPNRDQ